MLCFPHTHIYTWNAKTVGQYPVKITFFRVAYFGILEFWSKTKQQHKKNETRYRKVVNVCGSSNLLI